MADELAQVERDITADSSLSSSSRRNAAGLRSESWCVGLRCSVE
jgi:hypothetical protein